ncbi:RNA-binding protein 42-like isoform X2 [Oscarella lobularis]|uniref:RNA-binding protein 42-like isoform X2 n=1 Tax=Oscarella lobularis TaxID=121494 RepID=UPI003313406D
MSRFEREIGHDQGYGSGPPIHPPHLSMRASAPIPTLANRITDEEQRKWQANYSEGVEKEQESSPSGGWIVVERSQSFGMGQRFQKLTNLNFQQPLYDFRVFCGNLGNEVTDDTLARAFNHYSSFQKAKVIRDKRTRKTRGFGFISFADGHDYLKALKEMNGKYIGNRPVKLTKSVWKDRNIDEREKEAWL